MSASIKRNGDPEEGARSFPGITTGKSYPVQGYTGGGVVIINDDGKFAHVGFSDIDAGWTVTDDTAAKKAAADKAASDKAAATKKAAAADAASEAEQTETAEAETTT